ncbi:MAG: hypothetical protein QOH89_1953 [Pseudonocardiales bacterium]|nr:hypothetical protein [Pseudonocardiales bacterium]MDT4943055.1 hypothetical protein [Pseudonocardiales bacterium]
MTELELLGAALPAYDFQDVLGRGAWGIVVAAHHRRLNRPVAVKMLPLAFTSDDRVRRRFAAEARLLATLDHPHVVRIHDYIEQDEVCALVMERLTGGTLAERMQLGRMRQEHASAIQLATLHGLEHAHQHGVLHRDIKPENLMFAADGVLKITDFGIATVLGEQVERLTAAGIAMGTPAYMAPEQVSESAEVGEAADIWSAAAVYYEMLSGAVPYPRKASLQAALLARTRDEPKPIDEVAPDLPPQIGATVMRALDRRPEKRYPTSAAFADALEQAGSTVWGDDWLASTPTPLYKAAPRSASGGATTTGVVNQPAGPRTRERLRRNRRRTNVIIGLSAAAIVAAGVTVGVLAFGGDGSGGTDGHAADGGVRWGSWITPSKRIPEAPVQMGGLGPVPHGWGDRMAVGINLDDARQGAIGSHFGKGIAAEISFTSDPINGPGWNFHPSSAHPAADAIRKLESSGAQPYVNYYVLRLVGRGVGNDAAEQDVLDQLTDPVKMKAYWGDVTAFLKDLGSLDQPLPLDVEFDVASTVEALVGNARKAEAVVASSGIADLAGLPDNFAGWAQAWDRLRTKYAPKVMLGMPLSPWATGDYLVPFNNAAYESPVVFAWTSNFGKFYKTLGVKYDFINYIVASGEAGRLTTPDTDYFPHKLDFDRLYAYVLGLSQVAQTRVVLESVPVGNTVMAPENNTKFHWADGYAQWLLGDLGYAHLLKMREAGVIGIVFGFGYTGKDVTCPCDAAGDGQSQGNLPGFTASGQLAASSDDDGGYLHDRIRGYLSLGGMALH